jgi:hypothetical protein
MHRFVTRALKMMALCFSLTACPGTSNDEPDSGTASGADATLVGNADAGGGAGGTTTGGAGGTATGGSGGSAGMAGADVRCTSYPGITGCLCSEGSGGSIQECSKKSAGGTDQGFCCKDKFVCSCYRVACVSLPGIKSCDCGTPLDESGDRVGSCAKPTGGVCCLRESLGSGLARCKCSGYATKCDYGDREVVSCSLADIMMCADQEEIPVDRCK